MTLGHTVVEPFLALMGLHVAGDTLIAATVACLAVVIGALGFVLTDFEHRFRIPAPVAPPANGKLDSLADAQQGKPPVTSLLQSDALDSGTLPPGNSGQQAAPAIGLGFDE